MTRIEEYNFDFLDVPAWYRGAVHQENALKYLWAQLSDQQRRNFIHLWRRDTPGTLPYRPSHQAIRLIKEFEGLKLSSYRDPVGVWTVGWGHTATAHEGQVISLDMAEQLLLRDIAPKADHVSTLQPKSSRQCEFDAMLSFLFNVGITQFNQSSPLRLWRSGRKEEVPSALMRWVYGGGKVLPGLVRRRKAEGQLFSSGVF